MNDLILKIERMASPSREIDAEIEKSLPCSAEFARHNRGKTMSQWNERAFAFYNVADEGHEYRSPRYTASLDTAITLVPKLLAWSVSAIKSDACAAIESGDDRIPDFTGNAGTPALALCAAALRAREALAQQENET